MDISSINDNELLENSFLKELKWLNSEEKRIDELIQELIQELDLVEVDPERALEIEEQLNTSYAQQKEILSYTEERIYEIVRLSFCQT